MDIQFILRTLVYAQSFFWLFILFKDRLVFYLYDTEIKVSFAYFGMSIYSWVIVNAPSFSQYPAHLIGLYILMVLLCAGFFITKFSGKDAIALSFLIVFINSYYWEFMLHFNAIILYGLNFNQIIQMFHLFPAYFLVKRLEFYDKRKVIKWLLYGLVFSAVNVALITFGWRHLINPLTRVSTLGILITIVLNQLSVIKKEGGLDVYG
jgi:hypothetical protein